MSELYLQASKYHSNLEIHTTFFIVMYQGTSRVPVTSVPAPPHVAGTQENIRDHLGGP